MARQKYITRGTGIELSSDLRGLVDSILKSTPGGIGEVLRDAATEVADAAERTVPVKTGKLRDSIHVTTSVGDTSIAAGVGVGSPTVDYAYYVKGDKDKPGPYRDKSVWQEAIRKPAIKATDKILRDGSDVILTAAKRGGGR